MKKLNIIPLIALLALLSAFTGCPKEEKKVIELKVGQTWKYRYNADNPYEKSPMLFRTIIDVEGEYVQYVQDGGDTLSDSKSMFVVNSVLVEQCK